MRTEQPMPGIENTLTRKLDRCGVNVADLAMELSKLTANRRNISRHTELIVQGRPYNHFSVLLSGSGIRYKLLADGRRQIVNFVVPGDFIGLRGMVYQRAFNSVTILEPSEVATLERRAFDDLCRGHPNISAIVYWTGALEQMVLSERVVMLGRRTARERLAYLFLELWARLEAVGLARANAYRFPLSHDILADALGLSKTHITRTLRDLKSDGLVSFDRPDVVIHNREELASIAEFDDDQLTRYWPNFSLDVGQSRG